MPAISVITKLIKCEAIITEPLPLNACETKQITIDVLRLDQLHPVISGNKYFKLRIPVQKAHNGGATGILSFGGHYSNHLVALAYVCAQSGLACRAYIRGEASSMLSPTLKDAISYGLEPLYVSRSEYSDKRSLSDQFLKKNPGFVAIPEGGQSPDGVAGASEILNLSDNTHYDVIACSVGTGTMMAGLLSASTATQKVLGFSALKIREPSEGNTESDNQTDTRNDIERFIKGFSGKKEFNINYNYHFGGYAKKNAELISFMNRLWSDHKLPTDFVYTGKMFYGLENLVKNDHFSPGTRILAIHSGGLQGNRSISSQLSF
jgi:1-aminocyclopropane-1-carboxylate deaminase/D-cysteine desulfhydrase-like pyridoxal-dependent ACC family enzyme